MAKKKQEFAKQDEQLQEVNEALTGAGKWIEDNSNLISWIVCGVAIVIMGIIALNRYVLQPRALDASNENAKAVVYFMAEDWDKALNGDDAECIGFEEIARKYKFYQFDTIKAALKAKTLCFFYSNPGNSQIFWFSTRFFWQIFLYFLQCAISELINHTSSNFNLLFVICPYFLM